MGTDRDLHPFLERVTLPPDWRIVYEQVVESTMDLAREAARRGWPDRSVFVCDYQTAGRGRRGRRWEAPAGAGLLFTLLLRSSDAPMQRTMLASVALSEAIERLLGVEPSIKWPNDLLLGNRKLAGVLAEGYSGPAGGYVLVGCGVNANQDASDFASVGRAAVSLEQAAGRAVHRGELLVVCLERFEGWLGLAPEARAAALRAEWERRLWGVGRTLRIRDQGEEFWAVVEGVGADGALLARDERGVARRIVSGEIVLR
jgi:BirA family transcriptional regulator, biotin operon repressor / biotin---[acetyl-CoA-carboxylase] ligase